MNINWNNKTEVLAEIKIWGGNLKYASKELQNDKEFCLKSIKYNPFCFEYIPISMRDDRDIVLLAIQEQLKYADNNELVIRYLGDQLREEFKKYQKILTFEEVKKVEDLEEWQKSRCVEISEKLDYNIVTCGHCGSVIIADMRIETITCHDCLSEMEHCECPDLWYD